MLQEKNEIPVASSAACAHKLFDRLIHLSVFRNKESVDCAAINILWNLKQRWKHRIEYSLKRKCSLISANATKHFGSFELKEMFRCFNDRVDISVVSEDILMTSRFLRGWVNKKYILRRCWFFLAKRFLTSQQLLCSRRLISIAFPSWRSKSETWDISQSSIAASTESVIFTSLPVSFKASMMVH